MAAQAGGPIGSYGPTIRASSWGQRLVTTRFARHLAPMLTRPGEIVRRHDPDRFLTSLFAPADKRDALFALYAFDYELARARDAVSEPYLALIRLQWWRDVVEGAPRRHEVAEPLGEAIAAGQLARPDLLAILDAREMEAEPSIPSFEDWRGYLYGGAGGLAVAAARLLGAPEPERLRPVGAAYGAGRLLRGVRLLARRGRCLLPADRLAAHGLSPEAVIRKPDMASLDPVLAELAEEGEAILAEARHIRVPRQAVAAVLPA
ncbi:MAG: squalene/phytoene synthase family protein, partial [Acetobacteraceae bacterium]|nr:squalene/phytoene synthase family protein [Acetobacteraceae bacterium]